MINQELLETNGIIVSDSYAFFYGGVLSNFYKKKFEFNNKEFLTSEHAFMYQKALLFNDNAIAEKILSTSDPATAKGYGRSIKNYNDDLWKKHRYKAMVDACFPKFDQNVLLRNILLGTENLILVEASPYDDIWGIKLALSDNKINNPGLWNGSNLLGFALMDVRYRLSIIDGD